MCGRVTAEQVLESMLFEMSAGASATEHAFQRGRQEQVLRSMLCRTLHYTMFYILYHLYIAICDLISYAVLQDVTLTNNNPIQICVFKEQCPIMIVVKEQLFAKSSCQ